MRTESFGFSGLRFFSVTTQNVTVKLVIRAAFVKQKSTNVLMSTVTLENALIWLVGSSASVKLGLMAFTVKMTSTIV